MPRSAPQEWLVESQSGSDRTEIDREPSGLIQDQIEIQVRFTIAMATSSVRRPPQKARAAP